MKKLAILLMAASLLLGATACGAKEQQGTTGNTPASSNTQTQGAGDTQSASLPSAEELFDKMAKTGAELKSFAMETQMKQNIVVSQGGEQQEQNIELSMKSDMVREPVQMFQEMQIKTDQGDQNVSQYITTEGIYAQTNGTWVKLPDEMKDQMLASMESSMKPEAQFEQYKKIATDTKVAEEGNEYVLTAELSGDSLMKMGKELLNQAGSNEQAAAMMEAMTIKSMTVVSAVNKETYQPTRTDVKAVLEMEQDGAKVVMDMDMKNIFSKHNAVEEIKVPEEALKAASSQ